MPATSPSDLFEHLGLEALALAVAQVHAPQHRGPVLRLGAAGAGLDVDEAVVRVQRVVEHAPEFELGDGASRAPRRRPRSTAASRRRPRRAPSRTARGSRPARCRVGAVRVTTSSSGFFSRPSSWARLGSFQTFGSSSSLATSSRRCCLGIEVKDTSAARPGARAGRPAWRRSVELFRFHGICGRRPKGRIIRSQRRRSAAAVPGPDRR